MSLRHLEAMSFVLNDYIITGDTIGPRQKIMDHNVSFTDELADFENSFLSLKDHDMFFGGSDSDGGEELNDGEDILGLDTQEEDRCSR